MTTNKVDFADFKNNLDKITDNVLNTDDHVIIAKSKNRKVVLMSEKEYDSLKETSYVLANEEDRKDLIESIHELNRHENKVLTEEEWTKMSKQ